MWTHASPCNRIQIMLAIFCLILGGVTKIVGPLALKFAVEALSNETHALSNISKQTLHGYFEKALADGILPGSALFWVLFYIANRFINGMLTHLQLLFFWPGKVACISGISKQVMANLHKQPLSFHLQRETGGVMQTASQSTMAFGDATLVIVIQVFPIVFETCLIIFVFLVTIKFYYSIIIGITISLYLIATHRFTNMRVSRIKGEYKSYNTYSQHALDSLVNFETVKYFNAERHEEKRI